MNNLNFKKAQEILSNLQSKTIAVIGDVMLDKYYWGTVSRVSPEAPVPVIDLEKETYHLGGAANVASNLASLGVNTHIASVLGQDKSGLAFREIAERSGMNTKGLYLDENRPTTVKTRVMGNNQHIARMDREVRTPISCDAADYILEFLQKTPELSAIILEDYNKGTLTESLIHNIIGFAESKKIAVFVDPKFDNFFAYKGVTVFKPNKKEAAGALNVKINDKEDLYRVGKELLNKLQCDNVLLTLGADGMMLFEQNGEIGHIPTIARHISDVSGAGDTVIAVLAAAYCSGASIQEAASLANYAAGVVCESPGIVSIKPNELLKVIPH